MKHIGQNADKQSAVLSSQFVNLSNTVKKQPLTITSSKDYGNTMYLESNESQGKDQVGHSSDPSEPNMLEKQKFSRQSQRDTTKMPMMLPKVQQQVQKTRELFDELTRDAVTSGEQLGEETVLEGRRSIILKKQLNKILPISLQYRTQYANQMSGLRGASCDGLVSDSNLEISAATKLKTGMSQLAPVVRVIADEREQLTGKKSPFIREIPVKERRPVRVYRGSTQNAVRRTQMCGFPMSKAVMTDVMTSMDDLAEVQSNQLLNVTANISYDSNFGKKAQHAKLTSYQHYRHNHKKKQSSLCNDEHIRFHSDMPMTDQQNTCDESYYGILSMKQSEKKHKSHKRCGKSGGGARNVNYDTKEMKAAVVNLVTTSNPDLSSDLESPCNVHDGQPNIKIFRSQRMAAELAKRLKNGGESGDVSLTAAGKKDFSSRETISELKAKIYGKIDRDHEDRSNDSDETRMMQLNSAETQKLLKSMQNVFNPNSNLYKTSSSMQFERARDFGLNKKKKTMKRKKQKQRDYQYSVDDIKAKQTSFFGNVLQERKVTENISNAIGGRSETSSALGSSIKIFRHQMQVSARELEQPSEEKPLPVINRDLSDKFLAKPSRTTTPEPYKIQTKLLSSTSQQFYETKVNFSGFKNSQRVNTLLGQSINPIDEGIKQDSIMTRLSYVPNLRVNFGKSGRAQSIDLDNFSQVQQPPKTAFIPTKKTNLKPVQKSLIEGETARSREQIQDNSSQQSSNRQINVSIYGAQSQQKKFQRVEEVNMFDCDKSQQWELQKTDLHQRSHTSEQISRKSSQVLGSQISKSKALVQTTVLPEPYLSQSRDYLPDFSKLQRAFSHLQQFNTKGGKQSVKMQRMQPHARVKMSDQWDFKTKSSGVWGNEKTALAPSLCIIDMKPEIEGTRTDLSYFNQMRLRQDIKLESVIQELKKTYIETADERDMDLELAQKLIDQATRKADKVVQTEDPVALIQQSVEKGIKRAKKKIQTKKNKRRDVIVAGFFQKQTVNKEKITKEKIEEEEAKDDGDKDSFYSAEVVSTDNEDCDADYLRALKEEEIEKDVLRKMNDAINQEEQNEMKDGEVSTREKSKLTKEHLATSESRGKRFEEMFTNKSSGVQLEPIIEINVSNHQLNLDKAPTSENEHVAQKQLSETGRKESEKVLTQFKAAAPCEKIQQPKRKNKGDDDESSVYSELSDDGQSPKAKEHAFAQLGNFLGAMQIDLLKIKDVCFPDPERIRAKKKMLSVAKTGPKDLFRSISAAGPGAVMNSLKFKKIFKENSSAADEIFKNDPMYIYQKRILEEGDVLLPLINKIENKQFILKDYTLNTSHCQALADCMKQTQKPEVDIVYLDNCGVDDEEFSSLLEGFCQQPQMNLLFYKENIMGPLALESLRPMIIKRFPNHLRSLKLVKLNTSGVFINQLLDMIVDHSASLNSLSLVQLRLSTTNVHKIIEFLECSIGLEELDLSWNNFRPNDFVPLAEHFAKNVVIRVLNLSWNLMIASNMQKEKSEMQYPMNKSQFFSRDAWEMNHSELMADNFSRLIRNNQQLQHLDLANMGLSEVFLFNMLPALRRAKSLLAFHVGSNPGITERLVEYYQDKLRVAPDELPCAIQVAKEKNVFKLAVESPDAEFTYSERMLKLLKQKSNLVQQLQVEETYALSRVNKELMISSLSEVTVKSTSADMSIYRVLGHKVDIPKSGQWRMQTNSDEQKCWCCNGSIYSIIFWSRTIGKYHVQQSPQIDDTEKDRVTGIIQILNEEAENENPLPEYVPILYSNCTSWSGRPFVRFIDLLRNLKGVNSQPDFKQQAEQNMEQQKLFVQGIGEDFDRKGMHDWLLAETIRLKKEFKAGILSNHLNILKQKLPHKQPNLINYELMQDPADTFVLPIFIKPGRTHFFVKDACQKQKKNKHLMSVREKIEEQKAEEEVRKIYYNRQIIEVRSEELPQIVKEIKKNDSSSKNVFNKQTSVFRNWKDDTQATIKSCLQHDFGYWKVGKFIKDEEEYKECERIIKKYFLPLSQVFIQTVAKGGTIPDLSQYEFTQFCTTAKLFDKALTAQVLDIAFAATNYEEDDQDGNDDRALIRFEFFEILIRMVKSKYLDTKRETSISIGLEKIIEEHILQMCDLHYQSKEFRVGQLWDFDVNLLFEKNLSLLEKLYQALRKTPTKQRATKGQHQASSKFCGWYNLIEHISNPIINLGLSSRQLQAAFMLSKMTVEKENEHGPKEYFCIKFVEFLEFIGRIAWLKFQDSVKHDAWGLDKKCYEVLTCLFRFIDAQPIDPQANDGQISDSDEDY